MAKYFIDYTDRHGAVSEILVDIPDERVINRGDYLCYNGCVTMGNGMVIREPQISRTRKHPIITGVVINR